MCADFLGFFGRELVRKNRNKISKFSFIISWTYKKLHAVINRHLSPIFYRTILYIWETESQKFLIRRDVLYFFLRKFPPIYIRKFFFKFLIQENFSYRFVTNPIRPGGDGGGGWGRGGLRGPDDQIHSCYSETYYSMMPKICKF